MIYRMRRYREMKFISKEQMQTEEFSSISDDNRKNNGGLMTGIEKSLSEIFMFIFSVVLHLSHSLEGEHGAKL
jgi:hypothetical protein